MNSQERAELYDGFITSDTNPVAIYAMTVTKLSEHITDLVAHENHSANEIAEALHKRAAEIVIDAIYDDTIGINDANVRADGLHEIENWLEQQTLVRHETIASLAAKREAH